MRGTERPPPSGAMPPLITHCAGPNTVQWPTWARLGRAYRCCPWHATARDGSLPWGGVRGDWHARHAADVRVTLRRFLSHVASALRSGCEGRALYVYRDFPERLPSCTILTIGACARGQAQVRVAAAVAVRKAALFPRCVLPERGRELGGLRSHSSVKVGQEDMSGHFTDGQEAGRVFQCMPSGE